MAFKDDMQKRTRNYALRALKLCNTLQNSNNARILSNQLLRCSTSAAANHRAACRARSRADFLAKLKICEEEADESWFWLDMLTAGGMVEQCKVQALMQESHEIASILATACISTKSNQPSASGSSCAERA